MYVYAEEVFLINLSMNMIICISVCRIRGMKRYYFRAFGAALTGGVYSVAALYCPAGIISKIIICILMGYIITDKSLYDTLNTAGLLFLASAISSGGVMLLSGLISEYITVKPKILLTTLGAFTGISLFRVSIGGIMNFYSEKSLTVLSEAVFMDRRKTLLLFNDSGNLARSISGERVTLLSEESFISLCPELKDKIGGDIAEMMISDEKYKGRISFITAASINGHKMLPVIKIDCIKAENTIFSPAYICPAKIDSEIFDGIINLYNTGGKYDKENDT